MLHGYADGVEEHKNDDEPVELLRFYRLSYPVPESSLGQPKLLARSLFFRRGSPRKPYKPYIDRFNNNFSIFVSLRYQSTDFLRACLFFFNFFFLFFFFFATTEMISSNFSNEFIRAIALYLVSALTNAFPIIYIVTRYNKLLPRKMLHRRTLKVCRHSVMYSISWSDSRNFLL